VRDREAKTSLARVPRMADTTGQAANRLRDVQGACQQCGARKQLRFDHYGVATDDMIDADLRFCSASCLVAWWKGQTGEPGPGDVEPRLRSLIVPGKPRKPSEPDPDREPDDDDEYPA
jgi:hypothetical protein